MFWSWIFWSCAAFLGYTFVGYPVLVAFVALLRGRREQRAPILPFVTIIIPAHNEGSTIARKIENTLALDYPPDKREIIVASDGSTDDTAAIARSYSARGVRVIELPERKGKHCAQMFAVEASRGEILVFTDSSVELDSHALKRMISNFADPTVGCVSSEDEVRVGRKRWAGEQAYVSMEMALRRLEARAGSLVGVSGSFFAARREICADWHPNLSSDFFLPLHAVQQGMRAIVDPECRGRYGVVRTEKAELIRKVRTIVHGLDVLFRHAALLNPFRSGFFAIQLMSHKLFRWLVPFAAAAMLVASFPLRSDHEFYLLALALQLGLYSAGLFSLLAGPLASLKPLRLAGFFLLGNAATVIAWMYFLSGEKFVTWQPSRRA
jgi:glycosyltransferase involved in cell wall biosynthesis